MSLKDFETRAEYDKARLAERREFLSRNKLKQGCALCGYREHSAALHYDHLDPKEKSFELSTPTRSMAKIIAEMAKCRVICANCHAIETCRQKHHRHRN